MHGTKKAVDVDIITLFSIPKLGEVSIIAKSYPYFLAASQHKFLIAVISLSAVTSPINASLQLFAILSS